jgi:hypothetical protein
MALKEQVKALGGAAVAGLTALGAALAPPETAVTALEWVGVAVTSIGTWLTVYGLSQPASTAALLKEPSDVLLWAAEQVQERGQLTKPADQP